ncbi:hypothetical protein PAXINDRAFT_169648 [Paxillus involutus ATCC 200175]|uniref:Uncharacterized protein n=1 Tax=Paxillus involutus ATCC 200175 TaxID=664439 RepID=A0A0C9U5J5_PAXIN|nr:hypothetical protein PAXINDRAFT_169648 [Paxillus involutus ATCC 200175]
MFTGFWKVFPRGMVTMTLGRPTETRMPPTYPSNRARCLDRNSIPTTSRRLTRNKKHIPLVISTSRMTALAGRRANILLGYQEKMTFKFQLPDPCPYHCPMQPKNLRASFTPTLLHF